jgi:hypothetical protein
MAGTTTQSRMMDRTDAGSVQSELPKQFNKLVADVETLRASGVGATLTGSATYDPPSLATGAQQSTTVTVTGAALGDFAECSFSLDLALTTMIAYVSAANTVTVIHRNGTAGTIDLAPGTLRARVRPQAATAPVAAAALTASKIGNDSGTAL